MTVVVNELDVVPAAAPGATGAGAPAPASAAGSPARTERLVETATRLRAERTRRLEAY